MKIVFIGTIDNRGGAALVSWQLRRELINQGHQVSMFVGNKYSDDPEVHKIPYYRGQFFLEKFFGNDLIFPRTDYLVDHPLIRQVDIIHCHNLHTSFFNLATLPKLARMKPLVWTQHDLWSITGGCTDSYHCRLDEPRPIFFGIGDTRKWLLKTKEKLYRQADFTVVANSQWMKQQLETSILKDKPLELIYNGIDTKVFKPKDRLGLRQRLGIAPDQFVLLFMAKGGLRNKLKGSDYFMKVMHHFATDSSILGICIGAEKPDVIPNRLCRMVPYTANAKVLADYFNAADVFVYPTLADSFGLVAAESLACGTPVVTFATDALPELVKHKHNGFVAEHQQVAGLIEGITWVQRLSSKQRQILSLTSRRRIETHYSLSKMTEKYLTLYQNLVDRFE